MIAPSVTSWEHVAAQKKRQIESAIPSKYYVDKALSDSHNAVDLPRKSGSMTGRELLITESRAVDLVKFSAKRTYTAVEVTTAFCKRAAIAHQATNCLAVVLFEDASKQAEELDRYMALHGKPKGPLHGLPISVKEHIYSDGTPATSGLISWKDEISPADASIVKIFREAGAVFHVKTTNPQCLMALETHSNLYGRTTNPYNKNLTSGGSSGGESALIAMRGSVSGIGTDIGGSIRTPSAFCGGYGLKPSIARSPHSGLSGLHSGMENIIGCVGPMANCIEDVQSFCQVALDYKPWEVEPSSMPMPWRRRRAEAVPKKLTIGVMWNDGVVTPHPPVTRALNQAVAKSRAAGHRVVDWDPKYHASSVKWINQAYFLDGAREYREALKEDNDPPVPISRWSMDTEGTQRCEVEDTWKLNVEHDRLRTSYAEQWRHSNIDILLCPANPSVASAHDESRYWGYTSAFNALDLPGTVFPVSTVQDTDVWEGTEPVLSEKDVEYRAFYSNDGPSKYREAPVALQLIGKRLQEESLLAMTEVISNLVRADVHVPSGVVGDTVQIQLGAAGKVTHLLEKKDGVNVRVQEVMA